MTTPPTGIQTVHHVGLTVADLDRSVAFYRDLLGCTPLARQEKKGGYLGAVVGYPEAHVTMCHLQLPGSDLILELFQYHAPEPLHGPLEPRRLGNAHLCFIVEDLDSEYARLQQAGVRFQSPPVEVDTGINAGGAALYLYDPDGITLELFQKPTPDNAGSQR